MGVSRRSPGSAMINYKALRTAANDRRMALSVDLRLNFRDRSVWHPGREESFCPCNSVEVFRWEPVGGRDEAQIDPDRALISRLGVYPIKTGKSA
jgi:hypothetical protein